MEIGVILRCFSRTPELVERQVSEVSSVVKKFTEISLALPGYIKRIDVVIPINPDFIDVDCGKTGEHLTGKLDTDLTTDVWETDQDLFSGLVNQFAAYQLSRQCTHSLVVSSSCASLLSKENLEALVKPIDDDCAEVSGLVLPDPTLGEFIRRGCITNTFAIWNLISFFTVGGLDLSLRNRFKDERFNNYVRGAEDEAIPITGLEIPTLARLIESYGQCIAPVMPVTGGEWRRPDPTIDPEGYAREQAKMKSKAERHDAIAARYGFSLSYIKSGILPGYPK